MAVPQGECCSPVRFSFPADFESHGNVSLTLFLSRSWQSGVLSGTKGIAFLLNKSSRAYSSDSQPMGCNLFRGVK